MTNPPLDTTLSRCHKKPLKVVSDGEGTAYWICSECKNPSDPTDMSKKPQNVNTSAQHINDGDMSIAIEKILGILFGKINSNPKTSNYIFDEDDEAIKQATQSLMKLLQEAEETGRRKEEHYWVDYYSREVNALDGWEDPLAKNRCKIARKLHQDRLASLADKEK